MKEPEDILIREGAHLRRIAFAILRDEARADDVLQEAWLMTRTCRPSDYEDERAWLGGVVRNLALNARREERRRRARERAAARSEQLEATAEIAARRSVLQHLAEGVATLDEPVHTPFSLHYLEGLEVKQIAARLGRPLPTVKDQIRRGLSLLRGKMRGRFGDSRGWCLALIAAFDWEGEELQAVGRSATRSLRSTSALTGAGLLGLVSIGLWSLWDAGAPDETAVATATPEAGSGRERPQVVVGAPLRTRGPVTAVAPAGDEQLPAQTVPPAYASLEVRVTDVHGLPISRAEVLVATRVLSSNLPGGSRSMNVKTGTIEAGRTDADGRLLIDVPEEWVGPVAGELNGVGLRCIAPGFAANWNYAVEIQPGRSARVSIALESPECSLMVRVVDHHGDPVTRFGSAILGIGDTGTSKWQPGVLRFPAGVFSSVMEGSAVVADTLSSGPKEVVIFVPGVGVAIQRVECGPREEFRVAVGPPRRVFGHIKETDGSAVQGATVWFSLPASLYIAPEWSHTTSDAEGYYELWIGDQPNAILTALHPVIQGLSAGSVIPFQSGVDEELDLAFESRELLRLRLVDTRNRPLAGWLATPMDRARYDQTSEVGLVTDEQGRLQALVRGKLPMDVGVWGRAAYTGLTRWTFSGLVPGPEEHQLVIDTDLSPQGAILGEIRAEGWAAPCQLVAQVCQSLDGRYVLFDLPCPGEVFALEGLPAGEFQLTLKGPGALRMSLGVQPVPVDDYVDLGSIELPPPTRVRFAAAGGAAVEGAILRSQVRIGVPYCGEPCLETQGWIQDPVELFPGHYTLVLWTSTESRTTWPFDVPRQPEALISIGG